MEQIDFFNLLPDVTLDEVFAAYLACRRRKRRSLSSLRFEQHCEQNVINLYHDVVNRSYRTRPSKAFIVAKPVQREVFAAHFRDRVVHHLIVGQLTPLFERIFLDESYSCRLGKGTLYGIQSVKQMMRECSHYYTEDCYVLRLDIHGFFFHIDKRILYRQIKQLMDRSYFHADKSTILFLIREILRDNPVSRCYIQGSISDWEGLPPTKSLFHSGKYKGLPIGNLTSQIFANFYLNDFDHYVVGLDQRLFYGRYVDDIVIMHPSRDFLLDVKEKVKIYLKNKLGLTLHPKKTSLQHYGKGFSFIGAYIKPGRIYPGKRLRRSFYMRVQALNAEWRRNRKRVNRPLIEKTVSSLNSYFGILKQFDSWRVRLKGWNMLDEKVRHLLRTDNRLLKVSLERRVKKQVIDDARKMFIRPMKCARKYRNGPLDPDMPFESAE